MDEEVPTGPVKVAGRRRPPDRLRGLALDQPGDLEAFWPQVYPFPADDLRPAEGVGLWCRSPAIHRGHLRGTN